MLEYLESFFYVLNSLLKLIINLITSVAYSLQQLPLWIAELAVWTAMLPAFVVPFIMYGIAISVVLLIVGRN
jgi:hypothetical protein